MEKDEQGNVVIIFGSREGFYLYFTFKEQER